jgi:hypothetical protein
MPAKLNAQQNDLLGKIRAHLAQLEAKYGFTTRLARENGWARDFAQRVTEEYARFLFIAREGGHPVSPPPIIDKAWHLHLVHTAEYWDDLCPNILKMQLHHSPATGTHSEAAKLADWSGMTVATYQKFFDPPPTLWLPSPRRRRRSPAMRVGLVMGVVGIAAMINGILDHGPGLIVFGGILIAAGLITIVIVYRATGAGNGGADGGTSCGTSCGSGDGGHGGHGCGGHGCGGHGCGGGGCGGGH